VILDILENLFCGNEKVLQALTCPAFDTYMTLLRMLIKHKGGDATTRANQALVKKIVSLFSTYELNINL
jgi:hypothetical protein